MKHLLCVIFLLSVVALEMALGLDDQDTNCSKLKFEKLQSKCCKIPFSEVINITGTDCPGPVKNLPWTNSYQINTLQDKLLYNFVSETDNQNVKELCSAGAFMECIFKQKGWLESGSDNINVGALKKHVVTMAPDTYWKGIVDKMLTPLDLQRLNVYSYDFKSIVNDQYESIMCPKILREDVRVNLLPLMMMQLIQSELIWMCPQLEEYTKLNNCLETLENYQFCDAEKIFSTTGQGVFFFSQV